MIPHPLQQLSAFAANFYEPVDTRTQVSRMPGTADAPCICQQNACHWPFCPWHYSALKEDK